MTMTAEALINWLWTQSWQLSALAVLLLPVASLVARRRPHLAYVICFLLIIKALFPLSIGHQNSAFHWALSSLDASAPASASEIPTVERSENFETPTGVENSTENETVAALDRLSSQILSQQPEITTEFNEDIHTTEPSPARELPAQISNAFLSWILLSAWLAGMLTSLLIILKRRGRLAESIRLASRVEDTPIRELVKTIKKQLGIERSVAVFGVPEFTSPAIIGWRNPRILLPKPYLQTASKEDLEAVIAHELVHIKRGDIFLSGIQCMVQVIWWFHPVIWLANKRLHHLKELCCDGEVLHRTQIKSTSYAQALLNVVKHTQTFPLPNYVPTVGSNEITTYRIETLMKNPKHLTHTTPLYGWLFALASILFLLPGANLNSASSSEQTAFPNSRTQEPKTTSKAPLPPQPSQYSETKFLDTEVKPRRKSATSTYVEVPVSKILTVSRQNHLRYDNSGSGTLVPRHQYLIQTSSDGTIRRMNLLPGNEVKKGDLLLELSNESLVASLREAELDLRQAQAELRRHETSVEQKFLELTSNLETAKLNLELTESELRRLKTLFEKSHTTRENVEQGQTKHAQAKQVLDTAMRSVAITERQNELDLDLRKIQIERHTLALDSIRKQVEGLRVYAPIAGKITESSSTELLQLGAYVKSGTQLAQIFQPDQLTLVANYPARSIHKIEEGMPCIIEIEEHRHEAQIRTIYPTTNSKQRVKVLVDPKPGESLAKTILPGSSAKVYFGTELIPNALTIPNVLRSAAIGDLSFYKLNPDGTVAKETQIELISKGLKTSQLRGDLKHGDRLIYMGQRGNNQRARFETIELIDEPR